MPGAKQNLFIPLGAGIATDIDDHLLPVGKSLDVVNMNIYETGNLRKRMGYGLLTSTLTQSGGTKSATWQLASRKGTVCSLSVPGKNALADYSPAASAWAASVPSLGGSSADGSLQPRRGPIITSLKKLASPGARPAIAFGGGYIWSLYRNETLAIQSLTLDVYDATTQNLVTTFALFATAGAAAIANWDLVYVNGFAVAVIVGTAASGIRFNKVNASTLVASATDLVVTVAASTHADLIVKDATTVSFIYADVASLAAGVDFVPSTSTVTQWTLNDAAAATVLVDRAICWVRDLTFSGKLAIVTIGSVQGLRVQWDIPTTGATRQAASTYNADPAATGAVMVVIGHTTSALSTGQFQICYTVAGTSGVYNNTKMATRIGGVLAAGTTIRGLTLVSKAWTNDFLDFYAIFGFASATQGNSYVVKLPTSASAGAPTGAQSQFAIGSSGALTQSTSFGTIPLTAAIVQPGASNQFVTVIQYLQRLSANADGTLNPARNAIELVTVSHLSATDTTTGPAVEAADNLIVPGGTIGQFDGVIYHELGFAYAPEPDTFTPQVTGAMTLLATYWYVFVYARLDATGRLWRSAPSIPKSVTLTGAQASVGVNVGSLRLTGYSIYDVVEIYRGAANDAVLFQKVGQVSNQPTADTVGYTDTISDVALSAGEELYTTGDILPNETIPGSPFIFVFQNRLWFISADDPTELWFSNVISPKNGPRFNSENVVRIADSHGAAYAAGVMDDKVVALKGDAIYSWNGDGPDDAGNGGYSPATIVALGVGTMKPRSVLSLPDGVIFDSTASRPGMQMIDRALNIYRAPSAPGAVSTPFGEAVLRYTGEIIQAAVLVPEQSQARFYCYSGVVLVYDLVTGGWTTSLLGVANVVSAVNTGNGVLVAASNGSLMLIEDTTGATYADNGVTYNARVGTPWIQIGSIEGFERLVQLIGAGRTMAAHTLTVDMYLDFDDNTIVQTKTFSMTVGSAGKWNWEWNRPRVARMSAVRFVITEASTAAGFQCEGVTALMTTRTGLARQATSTRGL